MTALVATNPQPGSSLELASPARGNNPDRSARLRHVSDGGLAILIDDDALDGAGRGIFFAAAPVLAADQVTTMALHGRGILSIALDSTTALRLGIPHMARSRHVHGDVPTFLVSIEAATCPGTGISADDRALTIRIAGDPRSTAESLVTPGHIIPLLIRRPLGEGSTLAEVAYSLLCSRTAGAAAAWCDILDDSGAVASAAICRTLAAELQMPSFTKHDLLAHLLAGSPTG